MANENIHARNAEVQRFACMENKIRIVEIVVDQFIVITANESRSARCVVDLVCVNMEKKSPMVRNVVVHLSANMGNESIEVRTVVDLQLAFIHPTSTNERFVVILVPDMVLSNALTVCCWIQM